MVKLRLNPPGYRRQEENPRANAAVKATTKTSAAAQALLDLARLRKTDIPTQDSKATNQHVAKGGPSKKRKAHDEDAPAAVPPSRKKAKKAPKKAASVNDISAAVPDEEDQPRADSYSPGFERRNSPVRQPVKKGKRRGRSRTPWTATAAEFPIYIDLDALQQSNQEQASVNEAVVPAYSIAAANEQESNAIGVAERQGETALPSLDKENVGAGQPGRRTKKATGSNRKATKNLDPPEEKQGTKRSAEADSDDDEASVPSQPPAKRQKLKLLFKGYIGPGTAPPQHAGTEKANEEDAAEGEEPVVENTQGLESNPNPEEEENPASEENGTKGEGVAESVQPITRTEGKPKLTWRVASPSTPPPYVGPPLAATELEQAREIEEENPTEEQAVVRKYMEESAIDPYVYWASRLESRDPERNSTSSAEPIPSSGSVNIIESTDPANPSTPSEDPSSYVPSLPALPRPIQSPQTQAQRTHALLSAPAIKYKNKPNNPPSPSQYGEAIVIPFQRLPDGSRVAYTPIPPRHEANNLMSADAWATMIDPRRDMLDMGIFMEHDKAWERGEEDERELKRKEDEREKEKREIEGGVYKGGEKRVRKQTKKVGD